MEEENKRKKLYNIIDEHNQQFCYNQLEGFTSRIGRMPLGPILELYGELLDDFRALILQPDYEVHQICLDEAYKLQKNKKLKEETIDKLTSHVLEKDEFGIRAAIQNIHFSLSDTEKATKEFVKHQIGHCRKLLNCKGNPQDFKGIVKEAYKTRENYANHIKEQEKILRKYMNATTSGQLGLGKIFTWMYDEIWENTVIKAHRKTIDELF